MGSSFAIEWAIAPDYGVFAVFVNIIIDNFSVDPTPSASAAG
jgi:hypothetical protein